MARFTENTAPIIVCSLEGVYWAVAIHHNAIFSPVYVLVYSMVLGVSSCCVVHLDYEQF
jgi:hypothetical protein